MMDKVISLIVFILMMEFMRRDLVFKNSIVRNTVYNF